MSRKNSAMAIKHAKARKMSAQLSNQQKTDASAMEYHFGDWAAPVNGVSLFFTPTQRSLKQRMAVRRLGA